MSSVSGVVESLTCPECHARVQRVAGIEISGVYDGVLYWRCLDCGHVWNRWPEDHHRHRLAEDYIARERQRRGL